MVATICFISSPVRRVECEVLRDLALPAIAVGEQTLLVVVEFLARLSGEFEIRAFHDGVDRAGLLAQAAIDAFHHVDVVAGGSPGAVVAARSGLDRDGQGRANGLAQFAGDAALLAIRIAAQRMLAAEARRERPLFERIVERRLALEEVAHRQRDGADEFLQEQRSRRLAQSHDSSPHCGTGAHPANCSTPATIATMASESGRNTFQPSRINWS